ncbi:MAG TPA: hypothetical protein VK525_02400 [Candidatus Saccharimonadales bacterium]|nr:hypothetical protein [Candidatus Saccharimonadales bacterium]
MPNDATRQRKFIVLAVLGLFLMVAGIGVGYDGWRDYRTLGTAPVDMTLEQALPSPSTTPDDARWVILAGVTQFDCNSILNEHVGTTVTHQQYLATDEANERFIFLKTDGHTTCGQVPQYIPGILKKADPGLPAWLKDKGINLPTMKYPLLELEMNATPSSPKIQIYTGVGMFLFGLIAAIIFFRLRPHS